MVAASALRDRVVKEVGHVVVSKERETELLLVSLLARGHTLIEGVPGVSKTLLAKSFSDCLGLGFRRVQFTPDMLPLDIVGGFVFNMKDREFEFRRGPIFTNILLADEINRSPPKVQSALLESMQERQVTIEGHTEVLPSPHMVIATQNSVEFQGVYPLPEAQLDRFMMRIGMGYPSVADEAAILRRNMTEMGPESIRNVVTPEEL
jgi:MoxR-like ATPase